MDFEPMPVSEHIRRAIHLADVPLIFSLDNFLTPEECQARGCSRG